MALLPLSIICAWRAADRAAHLPAPEFLAVGGVEHMKVAAQIAKEPDASAVRGVLRRGRGRGGAT